MRTIVPYCYEILASGILASVKSIWRNIRLHYGFQSTGGHFYDFASICLDPDDKPLDLYQRLVAFVEDKLLTVDRNVSHHGEPPTKDETVSATTEIFIVLTWLCLLEADLPKRVKQRYGTELRSLTLALPSLLDEARAAGDAKVMQAAASHFRQFPRQSGISSGQGSTIKRGQ